MIYYVEDDDNIRELVIYTLTQAGFDAEGFAQAQDFYAALKKETPALVLLDVMLPDTDGFSILKRLHMEMPDLPVVMVTAKGAEYDRVRGLDLGADDYIVKPFGMAELVARVKARLRRTPNAERLRAGDLVLDLRAHAVTAAGKRVELTYKEYELLRVLMENRGAVLSREQLLTKIWEYDYDGGTRTVDVHIQTLRAKLGPCGDMVETVRGVGYRLGVSDHEGSERP